MKKIVIFGNGQIARTVAYYCQAWQLAEVCGFAVDRNFMNADAYLNRPLVAADEMTDRFPSDEYSAFVAVGYQDFNGFRARKVAELKTRGYELISVIHPTAIPLVQTGDNSMVISGETLFEPFVVLGSNVFIWSGVSLSHYVEVRDNTWISNSSVVGGNVTIGKDCFIGLNVTINNRVTVGNGCLVGSGSLVTRDLPDGKAMLPEATAPAPADARLIKTLLK
jgi:sugar O-acyltransferase (sialic acid O-acetyltransferase NeuD family)